MGASGNSPASCPSWSAAVDLLDQLVGEFPEVPAYRGDRGLTRLSLGALALRQPDPARARRHLLASVDDLEAALTHNPDHPAYFPAAVTAYQRLADALVARGEHAGARARAERLVRAFPERGRGTFLAACFLARCVAAAEEAGPGAGDGTGAYLGQARALLEGARRRGERGALERLRSADEFKPLRSRPEFAALLKAPGR